MPRPPKPCWHCGGKKRLPNHRQCYPCKGLGYVDRVRTARPTTSEPLSYRPEPFERYVIARATIVLYETEPLGGPYQTEEEATALSVPLSETLRGRVYVVRLNRDLTHDIIWRWNSDASHWESY